MVNMKTSFSRVFKLQGLIKQQQRPIHEVTRNHTKEFWVPFVWLRGSFLVLDLLTEIYLIDRVSRALPA